MKTKTNIISKKLFLVLFAILIMAGFGFLKSDPIQAKSTSPDSSKLGYCYSNQPQGKISLISLPIWDEKNVTHQQCIDDFKAEQKKYPHKGLTKCYFKEGVSSIASDVPTKQVAGEPSCHWLKSPFVCMLLLVLRLMGMFLTLATTIFAWIIDPGNMSIVMDNNAVYQTWALVRDFLNIAFILILLFSAFATIFQVDKYNYKKILLRLIIMALLVNFSYPIARFIIDFSNVLMYQILNNLGATNGAKLFSSIADKGALYNIIHPTGSNPDKLYLLSAIIFVFILAVTFLMIALMFVIRTVALAILIIFSPIAFVGSIIPDIAAQAASWWNYLFKYALFGPIMVFIIEIAVSMTAAISRVDQGKISLMQIANAQSVNPGMIAAMTTFSVPIVILWLGLGFAQSSSVAGAGIITQQGKKFMGGTGKWTVGKLGGNFAAGTYRHYKEERAKREAILEEGRLRTKLGRYAGRKPGELRDKAQGSKIWGEGEGKLGKFARKATGIEEARNRMDVTRRENIQEQIKNWEKQGGAQEADLLATIHNKKKPIYQRQAAVIELADKYGFNGENAYQNYKEARMLVKGDSFLEKNLNDKVSKRRADLPLRYDIENPPEGKSSFSVARERLFAMSSADLGKINFKELFRNSDRDRVGRAAKLATENYFKSIKTHRKNEILKNINPANEAFLETELGVIFSPENPSKNPKNNTNNGNSQSNTGNSGNKNSGNDKNSQDQNQKEWNFKNGIWRRT